MEDILIYGAGDLCLEVIWYIEQINAVSHRYNIKGILDDYAVLGSMVGAYPVLGGINYFNGNKEPVSLIIAIAQPEISKKIADALSKYDFIAYPNIVSPYSTVSPDLKIGKGCIVPPGVVINVKVTMGDYVKIGQGALINHHCTINTHSFIGPNVTLTGHVEVGESCFIGAAATVLPELTIIDDTVVGAGAVVTKNIEESGVYVGFPAKRK